MKNPSLTQGIHETKNLQYICYCIVDNTSVLIFTLPLSCTVYIHLPLLFQLFSYFIVSTLQLGTLGLGATGTVHNVQCHKMYMNKHIISRAKS